MLGIEAFIEALTIFHREVTAKIFIFHEFINFKIEINE